MYKALPAIFAVVVVLIILGLIFHPVFTLSIIVLALVGLIYGLLKAVSTVFRR